MPSQVTLTLTPVVDHERLARLMDETRRKLYAKRATRRTRKGVKVRFRRQLAACINFSGLAKMKYSKRTVFVGGFAAQLVETFE